MDYSLLSRAPLFNGISSDEISRILSAVPYRVKKFKSGSMIFQSGEPIKSLAIVISGIVKGEMVDQAGRVIKIEDIPAPGALAAAFVFGNRNRYPVNVIGVTDSELLIIATADFLKILMSDGRILVNFLDMISNRSQFLSEKIKFLTFKTLRAKLAHLILEKAGSERLVVDLGMKQSELAEFFGVARPSVARAIREMEDEGVIEARGKIIRLLDKKRLSDQVLD